MVNDGLSEVWDNVLLDATLDDGDGCGRPLDGVDHVVAGEHAHHDRLEQPQVGHAQAVTIAGVGSNVLQGRDLSPFA